MKLKSDFQAPGDFCQIKRFPFLLEKILTFVCCVFKSGNLKCKFCFLEKNTDLYQDVVFRISDYLLYLIS